MTVDNKGNILLAGSVEDATVIRFLPNGVLDRSFGVDGIVDIVDWSIYETDAFYGQITNFAVQKDGGIIVTIDESPGVFFLARLVNGEQDLSFGDGGATVLQSDVLTSSSLAIDANGQILVGEPALQRYNG